MQISPAITNSCRSCTAKCCRGLAVVLTVPEAKRMVASLGLAPQDFLEFSSQIDSKKTPHYPFLAKAKGGIVDYHIVLKRRPVDCAFLGEDLACTVYEDRPHVCRLYPFDLDAKEMKKHALCPVKFEKEPGTAGVAKQLQQDLHEHGKIVRRWNVEHGEIPDIKKFSQYFG